MHQNRKLQPAKTVDLSKDQKKIFSNLFKAQDSFIEEQEENETNNEVLDNIEETVQDGTDADNITIDIGSNNGFSQTGSVTQTENYTAVNVSPNHVQEKEIKAITHGVHSTKTLRSEFLDLNVLKFVSPIVQKYLMESHNSQIECYKEGEKIEIDDHDATMDYIYVLNGSIQVTMTL